MIFTSDRQPIDLVADLVGAAEQVRVVLREPRTRVRPFSSPDCSQR
jgi:hypothetical protein